MAKSSPDGIFYKKAFATSRKSVLVQTDVHLKALLAILAISQVPAQTELERALTKCFSVWGVDLDARTEAKGIKIMLKLVSDSNKNMTTGTRTPQFLKTLITAYRSAPKPSGTAEDDPGVVLPAPTPSPRSSLSPEREPAENFN